MGMVGSYDKHERGTRFTVGDDCFDLKRDRIRTGYASHLGATYRGRSEPAAEYKDLLALVERAVIVEVQAMVRFEPLCRNLYWIARIYINGRLTIFIWGED
tara:strand:+ start:89 stop:391 length:303 start_codon:yes stop_codon:yes gene_type:complete